MTIYQADTFTRSNTTSPSWGSSTGGSTWTRPFGSATVYSVTSNKGVISNTPGTWDHFLLGSNSITTTMEGLVRVTVDNTASGFGVILRVATNGQTSYKIMYDGSGHLILYSDSPGTGLVQIGSTATFTVTVGLLYWIRGNVDAANTTLKGKIWVDGSAEPGSWTLTNTIPSGNKLTAGGGFGVVGNANNNLKFDSFTGTDGSSVVNTSNTSTNITGVSDSFNAGLVTTSSNTTVVVDTFVARQNASMSNTTALIESIIGRPVQPVIATNTTVVSEGLSAAQKATITNATTAIETMLFQQRATSSNTTAIIDANSIVSVPAATSTDPDAQMLYGDLLIQYARIRQDSHVYAQVQRLATVLYTPVRVLNEYAIPGYIAVLLPGSDWSSHTKLKTINQVSAFIVAHS